MILIIIAAHTIIGALCALHHIHRANFVHWLDLTLVFMLWPLYLLTLVMDGIGAIINKIVRWFS